MSDEECMSRERFEAWADEIGLTEMQRDRVLYVIRREWVRGRDSMAARMAREASQR